MITSARRRAPPCPRTWHSVRTCKCAEYSVHRVQPCKLLLPHYCPPSLGIIRPFDYTWCELLIGNDPTRRVEFSSPEARKSQTFLYISLFRRPTGYWHWITYKGCVIWYSGITPGTRTQCWLYPERRLCSMYTNWRWICISYSSIRSNPLRYCCYSHPIDMLDGCVVN